MARHGSIAEQLANYGKHAANDNRRRKARPPQYRGTLPALRWLWDNHPDLAPALAAALPRSDTNWFAEVEPSRQEIRPTVGELLRASHDDDGTPLIVENTKHGNDCFSTIGSLKFRNGALIEWGFTKKGKKLRPTDRARIAANDNKGSRSFSFYLSTKPTTPSPMAAEHYHRPISDAPALASMYDPLPGVEAARALLVSLGVDGAVSADNLPFPAKSYPSAVAEGAAFIGGLSNPSGNSSSGAVMWEAPEERRSNATAVIEEVAAGGSLKSIGMRLGYSEEYADRAGKAAIMDLAETLAAMKKTKINL